MQVWHIPYMFAPAGCAARGQFWIRQVSILLRVTNSSMTSSSGMSPILSPLDLTTVGASPFLRARMVHGRRGQREHECLVPFVGRCAMLALALTLSLSPLVQPLHLPLLYL